MSELVFFLEEPSARAMLEGIMPRILQDNHPVRYVVFEGKQDLDKNIIRKLRGYQFPGARFVIIRDKDGNDCILLKQALRDKCLDANKPETLIRIACHELESWYLADLAAVEAGLNITNIAKKQDSAKYRSPDSLANAAEELTRLTGEVYQKIAGSRAIGPHLNLDNQRSRSFAVLVEGLRRILVLDASIPNARVQSDTADHSDAQ